MTEHSWQSFQGDQNPVARFQENLVTFTPRVWVTPTLIGINVLIFVAFSLWFKSPFAVAAADAMAWGANFGPKTMHGQWWRLLTSMFLHFGILHVGLNMWVLKDIGWLLERLVGNWAFLLVYTLAGLGGSVASLAWNPQVVSAGASGAVFGLFGALLGFILLRRDTVPAEVLTHLRNSTLSFLLFNLVFGFSIAGIDTAAHLGGFATGLLCGLILSQPLTAEAVRRRPQRSALLALAGAFSLVSAIALLPAAPVDVHAELLDVAATEQRVLALYGTLAQQAQEGKTSDSQFADAVERDILPPWDGMRRQLEVLERVPGGNRDLLSQFYRSATLRQESWQDLVLGLRQGSAELMKAHHEKWNAAEEQVREMVSKAAK